MGRTRKGMIILVSIVMALSLALMSCKDTTVETPSSPGIVVKTEPGQQTPGTQEPGKQEPGQEPVQEPVVDAGKPQYGGRLNVLSQLNIDVFGAAAMPRGAGQDGYVLEQILGIDRMAGPPGRGETDYVEGVTDFKYVVGNLAENWETPAVGVWVLDIRQGVHFALNEDSPASMMVGGREMTAEDVAYSIEFLRDTPGSWVNFAEPSLIKNTVVERTGPWQITVRTPVAPTTGYLWIMGGGGNQYVWPKEMLQQYGTSNEWNDQVGTGPYILKDFVADSAATYDRNPNYWDTNPGGPGKGDQLPYPDGLNFLIVPDQSTRLAALRTGKADFLFNEITTREDTETLTRTNTDLQKAQTIVAPKQVSGRVDLPGQPFADKRVRQAMMLAIDHPTIVKDLYDGQAELIDSPARKTFDTIYIPLEELPAEVQELYGYNPEKAKQLLKDAGYPDGFKMKMILRNDPISSQSAETIKAMWSQVGIDVDLVVQEAGIFTGTWAGHQSTDLLLSDWPGGTGALFVRYSLGYYRGPNIFNNSHVNDPPGTDEIIENAFNIQSQNVMVNYPAADKALRDIIPYILENAFLIPMPAPYGYRVWQPWVKGYYGESSAKFFLRWVWIDQALKKEMGK